MSTPPPSIGTPGTSTRPYLVRALHDWCTDNGFTPYIAVFVDAKVTVPREYVKNNEIVLNVGFEATTALKLGNEQIEFKARFGGSSRDIFVPIDHVIAIYARENGQGMAFPAPSDAPAGMKPTGVATLPEKSVSGLRLASETSEGEAVSSNSDDDTPPDAPPPSGNRPALKRIK